MSRKPGRVILLPDKRMCILYNDQPLIKEKQMIVLHFIDEHFKLTGKTKLVKQSDWPEFVKTIKGIGMVD